MPRIPRACLAERRHLGLARRPLVEREAALCVVAAARPHSLHASLQMPHVGFLIASRAPPRGGRSTRHVAP